MGMFALCTALVPCPTFSDARRSSVVSVVVEPIRPSHITVCHDACCYGVGANCVVVEVGPMNYRKLRIAWSVVWGLAAVLIVVFWARSYWDFDELWIPVASESAYGVLSGE